jgi:hypothetical protein
MTDLWSLFESLILDTQGSATPRHARRSVGSPVIGCSALLSPWPNFWEVAAAVPVVENGQAKALILLPGGDT